MTIRSAGVLAASLLLVLAQASACARVKSEPPRGGTTPPRSERQAPTAPPAVEQSQPMPAEPPPKVTEQPPTATEAPKPAEPSQSKGTQPSQPKPPAPAPPKPPEPPRPRPGAAPPPPAQERAAIVDLTSAERRLRDTHAIGVFTKLALKKTSTTCWSDSARSTRGVAGRRSQNFARILIFSFSRWSRSCKTKIRRSRAISPRRATRSGIFWRIRPSSRPSDLREERMSARTPVWAAILSTIALVARPSQAEEDPAVLKDLDGCHRSAGSAVRASGQRHQAG
jgi:outer membrane biosynthesis protein TonB